MEVEIAAGCWARVFARVGLLLELQGSTEADWAFCCTHCTRSTAVAPMGASRSPHQVVPGKVTVGRKYLGSLVGIY